MFDQSVCADGGMHRDRKTSTGGIAEEGVLGKSRLCLAERAGEGFSQAELILRGATSRFEVDLRGVLGHAKRAIGKSAVDILRRGSVDCDFNVMQRTGTMRSEDTPCSMIGELT
jgi:hypothetical protein